MIYMTQRYVIQYRWNFRILRIEFKLRSMNPMFSELLFAGWGVALFAALVSLLKWKKRREMVARRLSKGLRSYAAGAQVAS